MSPQHCDIHPLISKNKKEYNISSIQSKSLPAKSRALWGGSTKIAGHFSGKSYGAKEVFCPSCPSSSPWEALLWTSAYDARSSKLTCQFYTILSRYVFCAAWFPPQLSCDFFSSFKAITHIFVVMCLYSQYILISSLTWSYIHTHTKKKLLKRNYVDRISLFLLLYARKKWKRITVHEL